MPKSSSAMRTPAARSARRVDRRKLRGVEQDAFRDLQLKPAGGEAALADDIEDAPGEVLGPELHGRDVDRDVAHRPTHRSLAGLAERPVAERLDQAGLLRDRYEDAGRNPSVRRMLPAESVPRRRRSRRSWPRRAADRLAPAAAALQRLAEIRLDLAPALDGVIHLFAEDAEAVAPFDLGAVERDIGLAHELGVVGAGLAARSPRRSRRRRRPSCRAARTAAPTAAMMRSQSASTSRPQVTSVWMMANSSPPSRATQSPTRTRPVRRRRARGSDRRRPDGRAYR